MKTGRTLAISDVHGCSKTFCALLKKIEFSPADTLYLLGDMIDRGPDSRSVINIVLDLMSGGFDVRPIRGNHEQLLVDAVQSDVFEDLEEWLENGGGATLRSYGAAHPREIPEHHVSFLKTLPYYRTTSDFLYVHAGVNTDLDDPFSARGRDYLLWDRSGVIDVTKLGNRRVICGHSTKALKDIRNALKKDLIRIDNGVCLTGIRGKGGLVAMDVGNSELYVQRNLDAM